VLKHWAEMTTVELREAISGETLVVLPVGATEQHGPHLPVHTDNTLVSRIVEASAERCDRGIVLVLPTFWVGFSPHHMGFVGSLTLQTETYISAITDICESILHHGFRKIAIVNGHGGNTNHLRVAVSKLAGNSSCKVVVVNYFDLINDRIQELAEEKWIGHAGEVETALHAYISPGAVRTDKFATLGEAESSNRLADPCFSFRYIDPATRPGFTGDPKRGSRILGEALVKAATERLSEVFSRLVDA